MRLEDHLVLNRYLHHLLGVDSFADLRDGPGEDRQSYFYGLTRKQPRYILDPHSLSKQDLADILDPWEDPTCTGPHLLPAAPALDFPGETFRVLKDKETKQFGEYRTRRLVLEAWGRWR